MNCHVCGDPDRDPCYIFNRAGEQVRVCEGCAEEMVLDPQVDWYMVGLIRKRNEWVPDRETIGDMKYHELKEDGLIMMIALMLAACYVVALCSIMGFRSR